MGSPMAQNLQKWLLENKLPALTVWTRTPSKLEEFKQHGCTIADTVEEIAEKCDIVITSLANDKVAEEVYAKLFAASAKTDKHTIFVETSTLYPTVTGRLEKQAASFPNRYLLCCPVMGPPPLAKAAKLVMIVSGDYHARKIVSQFLVPAMGRKILDVGSNVERAASLKLIGNSIVLGTIELLAESLTLADKSGVGGDVVYDLIQDFFPAPSFIGYGKKIITDNFVADGGFTLAGGLKDATHIRTLAASVDTPMPIVDVAHQHLVSARAAAHGTDLDWSSLVGGQRIASGLAPFKRDTSAIPTEEEADKKA